MIFILTAPIQSGKTTSLISWSAKRNDVHGILTPVVGGKRVFMNVQTKEHFPMEAKGEEETLVVGRFAFSKAGFDKAIQIIRDAINKEVCLIIDEIGPLELKGKGFCDVLKEVLEKKVQKLLLVVRDKNGMVEKVKKYFELTSAEVIKDISELT